MNNYPGGKPFDLEGKGANHFLISFSSFGRIRCSKNHFSLHCRTNSWILSAFRLSTRMEAASFFKSTWRSSSDLLLKHILSFSHLACRLIRCVTSRILSIFSISSTPSITVKTAPEQTRSVEKISSATSMLLLKFSRLILHRMVCSSSSLEVSWNIKDCRIDSADVLLARVWLMKANRVWLCGTSLACPTTVQDRNVFPVDRCQSQEEQFQKLQKVQTCSRYPMYPN